MPIFGYKCIKCGHITERIQPKYIQNSCISCEKCANAIAKIVDVNRTSFRLMPGGSGGFYSPSKS